MTCGWILRSKFWAAQKHRNIWTPLSFTVWPTLSTSHWQQISVSPWVTCQALFNVSIRHDTCPSRDEWGAAEAVLSHPRSADSVSAKIHLTTSMKESTAVLLPRCDHNITMPIIKFSHEIFCSASLGGDWVIKADNHIYATWFESKVDSLLNCLVPVPILVPKPTDVSPFDSTSSALRFSGAPFFVRWTNVEHLHLNSWLYRKVATAWGHLHLARYHRHNLSQPVDSLCVWQIVLYIHQTHRLDIESTQAQQIAIDS